MFFHNNKYSKDTLNIYLNQEKIIMTGVLMANLILKKGIDLTKERVKEEIKKRKNKETRIVIITKFGYRLIKSIAIYKNIICDVHDLFHPIIFEWIYSIEFLS